MLTFGDHDRESIQFVVEEIEKVSYVIIPCAIKLMEDEKGKVEVDELYLGFYLIHLLYIILPCGFIELLGVYKVRKKENKQIKWLLWVLSMSYLSLIVHIL